MVQVLTHMSEAKRRRLVWLLLAWIPLEVIAVGALAMRAPNATGWLRAGLVVDILIMAGLAIVLEARRAGGLTAVRTAAIVRAASLGVVAFAVLDRVLGIGALGSALALVAICELTIVGMELSSAGRALRRVRVALRGGGQARWWRALDSVQDGALLARALVTEACVHAAWLRSLLRRPLPVAAPGAFGVTATSSYPGLVVAMIVASAFELPVLHMFLSAKLGPGHAGVHVAVLALHVYSIAWLLGDRRLLHESAHEIAKGALMLRLGLRPSARVPLSAIASARVLAPPDPFAPRRREPGLVRVTPLDAPNVRLELSQPVVVRGLFGVRREARAIELYVDGPERFCGAVGEAMEMCRTMSALR